MQTSTTPQCNTANQVAQPNECEAAVGSNLRHALTFLHAARLNADTAGYGNQFQGCLADSIKGVESTLGMLA